MKPWLLVVDPLERLHPKTDTSLYLAQSALERRVPVYLATENDLSIEKSEVQVQAARVVSFAVDNRPSMEASKKKKLTDFAAIWIRKDPPFDTSYVRLCWLLGTAASKSLLLNDPELLLRYHEKMLPIEGLSQGFLKPADVTPTFLAAPQATLDFLKGQENCILKPFLGHGGRGVEKVQVTKLQPSQLSADTLVQPYLPDVEKLGDIRVFFIDGKMEGHFARFPKEGHYLSNLAQGGTPKVVALKASQKKTMERVSEFLKHLGIFFAGVDLIGNRVGEINITSPTGLRTYSQLYGVNLAEKLVAKALKQLR